MSRVATAALGGAALCLCLVAGAVPAEARGAADPGRASADAGSGEAPVPGTPTQPEDGTPDGGPTDAAPAPVQDAPPEAAAPGDEAGDAPTGRLTRAPELIRFVEAAYPEAAAAEGREATVRLSLVIDETGRVTEVEVLAPAGHGFDEAAVAAARQFRFTPAEVDGVPAPVQLTYEVGFVLEAAPSTAPGPGPTRLAGRVLERGTRTPLAGASVRVGEVAVATDEAGRFALAGLAPGEARVRVLSSGHAPFETTEEIPEDAALEVTYYLLPRRFDPFETVVRGERPRKEVVRRTLTLEEVQRIPGTRGDALRVVQTLPGVARTPYGLGPLVIRGAGPFDSRTFLDGHPIPLPFHFGGLTSIFNGDLVSGIELTPGAYGSRFGRAIGGVLRVDTRPGRGDALHGYADLDLFDAGFLLEGPLGADTTFAAAARRSYVDAILSLTLAEGDLRITPYYWDYQTRVDRALGGGATLSLAVYGSHDQLTVATQDPEAISADLRDRIRAAIDFHRVSASVRHRAGARLAAEHTLSLGWDGTFTSFGTDLFFDAALWVVSARSDWSWQADEGLALDFGFDGQLQRWALTALGPAVPAPGQVVDPTFSEDLVSTDAQGLLAWPALWADVTWTPWEAVQLVGGLRLDADFSDTPRAFPQPRGTARWTLDPATTVKLGAGLYRQPVQPALLVPGFGNPRLGWEAAVHTAVGVERRLVSWLAADLGVFWEPRFDLAVRSDAYVTRDGEAVRENFRNAGRGRAVGLELYLKITEVRGVTAWLSYTLSRAWVQQDLGGPMSLFGLDQTHNLVAVASWEFAPGWAVGTGLRWVTGVPVAPVEAAVFDADADLYVPVTGEADGALRLSPFFSWDARLDRRFTFPTWSLAVYLEVTNLTNHPNVEGETWDFDFTERSALPGLPVFPSLGLRAAF